MRNPDGGEPDIPRYHVIEVEGPTNTRVYKVAVRFRNERLATGQGHSRQEAEMRAAEIALANSRHLFPSLNNRKRKNGTSVGSPLTKRRRRGVGRRSTGAADSNDNGDGRR